MPGKPALAAAVLVAAAGLGAAAAVDGLAAGLAAAVFGACAIASLVTRVTAAMSKYHEAVGTLNLKMLRIDKPKAVGDIFVLL
jgi:hypothetical protein